MNLLWRRTDPQQPHRTERLQQASAKADELEARSEKVAKELTARKRRNHWGETAAQIARAGGHH